jgi:hypothetical protein
MTSGKSKTKLIFTFSIILNLYHSEHKVKFFEKQNRGVFKTGAAADTEVPVEGLDRVFHRLYG